MTTQQDQPQTEGQQDLGLRVATLEGEMKSIPQQMEAMRQDIGTLRTDTFQAIDRLRTDTFQAIDRLRADTFQAIDSLRTDSNRAMESLRQSMDSLRNSLAVALIGGVIAIIITIIGSRFLE